MADTKQSVGASMHSLFKGKYFYANGKRKTSVAQVRLYEKGKEEIIVNGKSYKDYFTSTLLGLVTSPMKLVGLEGFSVTAKIVGGGTASQADALRHGIAKAIAEMHPEQRTTLKQVSHLTRDSRKVERKKPGRRKARKMQQWVKR